MKYAHLADLHLGAWRDPKMRDFSTRAFLTAIDQCLAQEVDFILFAGDLFNTSLPSLDTLKIVTKKLKELQDKNIPLYAIAGSHDFSPSGKTIIDVLENAGLLVNVCKGKVHPETKELQLRFTLDSKTGAKITGVLGRRGLLEKTYYECLQRESLEQEPGYKIFLFHTTVAELLPENLAMMEKQPISVFPRRFNYYAGGHIHHPINVELEGYGTAAYSGALFPNNFQEMEKYGGGGFYLIKVDNSFHQSSYTSEHFSHPRQKQTIEWMPLKIVEHKKIIFDCRGKSPDIITFELSECLQNQDLHNSIITIRLHGAMQSGKVGDIRFKEVFNKLYAQGAEYIMKNTNKLQNEEFAEIKVSEVAAEDIEEAVIKEHLQQTTVFAGEKEKELVKQLLLALNTSKKEGETQNDFQERIEAEMNQLLEKKS